MFVRGTTEGINLAAHAYVKQFLRPGDEIILTLLEYHANIVPWQLIAEETGAVLRVAPIDSTEQIILGEYAKQFNGRTRFVSAAHVSNALGTVAPVEEMIQIAHARNELKERRITALAVQDVETKRNGPESFCYLSGGVDKNPHQAWGSVHIRAVSFEAHFLEPVYS